MATGIFEGVVLNILVAVGRGGGGGGGGGGEDGLVIIKEED